MASIDDVIYTLRAEWRQERGRTKASASSSACFYNTTRAFVSLLQEEVEDYSPGAKPPTGLSLSPWIILSHKDRRRIYSRASLLLEFLAFLRVP